MALGGGRGELNARLTATNEASKVIEKVADQLEDLEKKADTEVTLSAEDKASKDVEALMRRLDRLTAEDREIAIRGQIKQLESEMRRAETVLRNIHKYDDDEIAVRLEARDNAKSKLDQLQTRLIDLDGETAEARVDADAADALADVDRVQSGLRDIDGQTAKVNIDSSGIDGIAEKLQGLAGGGGPLDDIVGALGKGGPVVGGTLAIAGSLFAAGQHAADLALQAQTTADLTGASVEDASRLQSVWKNSGADVNDLNDVLLQMNGVLRDNPEVAKQLGINLNDGKDIASRFVEVVEKLDRSTLGASEKAQLMSQAFGEEGVRQVQTLLTLIEGDLQGALDEVGDASVISPEEVERARQFKQQMTEAMTALKEMGTTVGQIVLPALEGAAGVTSAMVADLEKVLTFDVGSDSPLNPANWFGTGDHLDTLKELDEQITVTYNHQKSLDQAATDSAAAWDAARDSTVSYVEWLKSRAVSEDELADKARARAEADAEATAATDEQVAALEEAATAADEAAAASQREADAILAGISARRSAADSQFALNDARRAFDEQLGDYQALLEAEGTTLADLANAHDETAQAAGRVADAQVRVAQDMAKTMGATLSATDAGDVWRDSMIQQAAQAQGPLRDAILNYIGAVENIPPEKLSEIQALINEGKIDEAQRRLDETSATRQAELRADATNTQASAQKLDATAAQRIATILADARTQAANEGLNGVAARQRIADIVARALTGDAASDLGLTARQRDAIIRAIATGDAERVINNMARDRTVTIWTRNVPIAVADGGVFPARSFANGGHRLPREAVVQRPVGPAGLFQWAEPETGGESFIPHSPAKRRSALRVWLQTGKILGAIPMADGGVTTAGALPPAAPTMRGGDTIHIHGADINEVLAALRRERWRQNTIPVPGAWR